MEIRFAKLEDIEEILHIYNQGIEDRIATLEVDSKDMTYMTKWFADHADRYRVPVASVEGAVVGGASLHPYS